MNSQGPRRHRTITALCCTLLCLLVVQGCAGNDSLSDIGILPTGQSVVFAAPAGKSLSAGSAVPEPVVFRFRRVGEAEDQPTYLDLIGAVDQSVRIFAARPGT
jgi:hypothetical protein